MGMKCARECKGQSVITFPDEYIIIDIETTGLDPKFDSIIEVSAIRVSDSKEVGSFSELIKPDTYYIADDEYEDDYLNINGEKGYYIDSFISELTGITNEMLFESRNTEDVLRDFFDFVGDCHLIGHNVNFDINFLYDARLKYFNNPFENDFTDTMRIARKILPELKHHRLGDLAKYYNVDYSGAHRSLEDCYITEQCYVAMKKDIVCRYESYDLFIDSFKSKSKLVKRAKDYTTQKTSFNENGVLYNKICVITGKLEVMTRDEARQMIVDIGGINGDSVTKKTNYLILGNNDYNPLVRGGKSNKQRKAEELILKGADLRIISENVFYDIISEADESESFNIGEETVENPSQDYYEAPDGKIISIVQEKLIETSNACGLFEDSIRTTINYGKNGQITSYGVAIYEEEFPKIGAAKSTPVVNFKIINETTIEILVKKKQFQCIELPTCMEVKEIPSDNINIRVIFSLRDNKWLEYILHNVKYCLDNYTAKASAFGCCSKYKECSTVAACVHVNLLYAKACAYRKNLEQGNNYMINAN